MTLIYARRTGDLVYFLADTFSEEGGTAKKFNWFSEPIIKIIRRCDVVMSFSGNSHLAQKCISSINGENLEAAVSALCQSSSSREVDYAICHVPTKRLMFIRDGLVEERMSGYLGSKSGFEALQKHKIEKPQQNHGQLHILQLVDDAEKTANEDYSGSLSAFKAALIDSDGTFGGVAISYVVSTSKSEYGTYTSIYRGPISESEMPLSGWGTVPHQDTQHGAYRVEVWGSSAAMAIYFPDASLGHIFSNLEEANIEPKILRQTDGYDFTDEAVAAGCGVGGVATWKSWQNASYKAKQNLISKDFTRAQRRIEEIEKSIAVALSGRNPNKEINIDLDIVSSLQSCGSLPFTVDIINSITTLSELKLGYFEAVNDTVNRDFCSRQYATWKSWAEAILVEIQFK
jgi:hypothetical protein